MKPENWPINRLTRALRSGVEKVDKIISRKTPDQEKQKAVEELGNADTAEAKEYQLREKLKKNYDKNNE